jgi:formylglycine-generating enzyme required for sulfatase activity
MTGRRQSLAKGLVVGLALLLPMAASAEGQGARPLRECTDCPELVVIPAGKFIMGSPKDERGRFDSEGPQHAVTLRSFALGKYDVTVGEFSIFVRETGYEPGACNWPQDSYWRSPGIAQSDRQPVICVNWHDAQAYVAWLNDKVRGRAPKASDGPYRLPSEAEWEYAARAGTATARWWGDAIGVGHANCNGCGSPWDNREIAPVGSTPANPFGLFDMLGNVWQWTNDCWNDSYTAAPGDGRSWTAGDCNRRVLRGGSWSNLPKILRSASRSSGDAEDRAFDYASYTSFRVARTLP